MIKRLLPDLVQSGITVIIDLMPVSDIHFYSHRSDEIQANGQVATIWIFFSIGLFVLLLACINFMNLATARSSRRSKEIGMRKVMGAGRSQLIGQFLGEAVLMSLVGLVLALGLSALLIGPFSSLTGKAFSVVHLFQPDLMALFLISAVLAGLFAGSWPAFYLSAFRPALVLKGTLGQGGRAGGGSGWLRNGLVVFQFAISIGLIVATLTVFRQMEFLSSMPVGFDRHQVATIELTDPIPASRMPALREVFLQIPGVESVSSSAASPAGFFNDVRIRPVDAPQGESWPAYLYGVHFDYVETMGMEMVAGRSFSRDYPADTLDGLLINEAAAEAFGFGSPDEAIGREIEFAGGWQRLPVIGVVRDFLTGTAREQPGPVVMNFASFGFYGVVRLDARRAASIVPELEAAWSTIVPGYAFDLRFLDERFNALYTSETVLRKVLLWFSVLTVLIAALGLFGLAAHAAERRTREVGIRKVVGATSGSIIFLLTSDLTRLVFPAFLIAAPLTWWAMQQWLGGFAYAVRQSGWTYVATLVMALVIAAATVSIQSWRAATLDPVRTLRTD